MTNYFFKKESLVFVAYLTFYKSVYCLVWEQPWHCSGLNVVALLYTEVQELCKLVYTKTWHIALFSLFKVELYATKQSGKYFIFQFLGHGLDFNILNIYKMFRGCIMLLSFIFSDLKKCCLVCNKLFFFLEHSFKMKFD